MVLRFSVLIGLLLLGAGCGGGTDSNRVSVSGQVTLDEQPLANGVITFLPSDGKGPSASAKIENGEYETEIDPGPKNVSIQATEAAAEPTDSAARGDSHGGGGSASPKQLIPAKYNTNTELKYEVQASGNDDVNFDLNSK